MNPKAPPLPGYTIKHENIQLENPGSCRIHVKYDDFENEARAVKCEAKEQHSIVAETGEPYFGYWGEAVVFTSLSGESFKYTGVYGAFIRYTGVYGAFIRDWTGPNKVYAIDRVFRGNRRAVGDWLFHEVAASELPDNIKAAVKHFAHLQDH